MRTVTETRVEEARDSTTLELPPPQRIRIVAVGDLLMHMPVVNSALDAATGRYNFRDIFTECADYLRNADFTVANLETRLAGPERGYSGFPRFNTPADLAGDIKWLGVDLVTTANNHSMDMGKSGIITTLDNLDQAGLHHVGTHRSRQDREKPAIFNVSGIRLGVINYTEGTNGIPIPPGEDHLVNIIDRKAMLDEIEILKENGAHYIIAFLHFGTEYQRYPNEFQESLAADMLQRGVDAVVGCHPHVVQPVNVMTVERDGLLRKAVVAYSLGNFISNQRWRYSDCGMILVLELIRHEGGLVLLDDVKCVPVWVQVYNKDGRKKYRVLPVEKALSNTREDSGIPLTPEDLDRLLEVRGDSAGLLISKPLPVTGGVSPYSPGGNPPGQG